MKLNGNLRQDTLYNLGAFDTVDTSNADYDLITRRTGYKNLAELPWVFSTTHFECNVNIGAVGVGDDVKANIVCSTYKTETNSAVYNGSVTGISLNDDAYLRLSDSSLNGNVGLIQGQLEYQLATSYTEKVIKERPLNTLDQDGSQWVRDEYEKTVNLFGGAISTNRGSFSNGTFSSNKDSNTLSHLYIYLRVNGSNSTLLQKTTSGSFSISFSKTSDTTAIIPYDAGNYSDSYCSLDISGLPNGTYVLSGYFDNSDVNKSVISNLMLNEGSVALSYQPYYGPIVHGQNIIMSSDEYQCKVIEIGDILIQYGRSGSYASGGGVKDYEVSFSLPYADTNYLIMILSNQNTNEVASYPYNGTGYYDKTTTGFKARVSYTGSYSRGVDYLCIGKKA